MAVLSAEDRAFFEKNGYVVVRGAVPVEDCEAVVDAVFDFLGMDPNDPEDWYRPPHRPNGMVELYQHPALWKNRQNPRIYGAMVDLYQNEKLWVSIDRANFKPPPHPDHPEYDQKGFTHWDVDTTTVHQPLRVQGVLYLRDTTEDMGGFTCVPGFIGPVLEKWIAEQPADRDPRRPDLSRLPEGCSVQPIPGKAGDFVIWSTLLAHGNGHNTSGKPRFAQYIAMSPARENDEAARADRIMRWRERLAPDASWVYGDERGWEQKNCQTAELTPLGRKLLGLDRWED